MDEIVIAFTRTVDAMRGEMLLLDEGLNPLVMPMPSMIYAGCGICLRVRPEDLAQARACLSDIRTLWFVRHVSPGGSEYEPIVEGGQA